MIVAYYILSVVAVFVILMSLVKTSHAPNRNHGPAKCSPTTCGALAPVNDPKFNVQEVIKNTVLIEQHLAEKTKYCKECLVKHFLLSIGLLEEAMWMACGKKYPLLEESVGMYQAVFDNWRANMDDAQARLVALRKLRDWRQKMVRLYYFSKSG